ncbi:MAG: hypothetical protein KGO96_07350 [Elusimicrobia bacterium]|nr:hypothetical protein [Elusimicrobiota bacterium]
MAAFSPSNAAAQTMHGARAKLYVNGHLVGIFSQCSYGVSYDSTPVYVLGKVSPAEIVLSGQEPISVTATGWRIVNDPASSVPYLGPFDPNTVSMPKLSDIINQSDSVLDLHDLQTNQVVLHVEGVKVISFTTNITSRGLQEITR